MTEDRRKYLTNGELREEIAYAIGIDPTRYGPACRHGFLVEERRKVLREVTDGDDLRGLTRIELTNCIGEALAIEVNPTPDDWELNRDTLKAIHRALDAEDLREVAEP